MDSLENLRVLEGSEVFFRGLQHLTKQLFQAIKIKYGAVAKW